MKNPYSSLLITGVVPFLASAANGGRNKSVYEMTNYLHRLNEQTPIDATDTGIECAIFKSGIAAWLGAENHTLQDPSLAGENSRVVWAEVYPARCGYCSIITCPDCKCTEPSSCLGSTCANETNCASWDNLTIGIRPGALLNVTETSTVKGCAFRTTVSFNLSETVART